MKNIFNKRLTIIIIYSIIIVGVYSIPKLIKPKYEPLPEVRLVNQKEKNTKGFAIMVSNESSDGYEEYTNEDGTWPSEEEGYEFKEAKCIDNNGALVNNAVTFADGKVTLKTNKTIYCTMYFDKNMGRAPLEVLRENDPQNKLSSETVGGMYRFQGKNTDTINNYICFGTDNKEECACTDEKTCDDTKLDKYMYRIIGITEEGQLYLIKMKGVEEGSNKTFEQSKYDWPCSSLFEKLNGISTSGNIFINNTRYEYMVEGNKWYSKIENHNWKYGRSSFEWFNIDTASNALNVEDAWSDTTEAKIGLMYVHDYYFSYDSNRNWRSDCDGSSWVHYVNNKDTTGSSYGEFSIMFFRAWGPKSPPIPDQPSFDGSIATLTGDSCEAMPRYQPVCIRSSGCPDGDGCSEALARPTFYLSSSTTIKSGTGSITDPYMLSVN